MRVQHLLHVITSAWHAVSRASRLSDHGANPEPGAPGLVCGGAGLLPQDAPLPCPRLLSVPLQGSQRRQLPPVVGHSPPSPPTSPAAAGSTLRFGASASPWVPSPAADPAQRQDTQLRASRLRRRVRPGARHQRAQGCGLAGPCSPTGRDSGCDLQPPGHRLQRPLVTLSPAGVLRAPTPSSVVQGLEHGSPSKGHPLL